MQAIVRSPKTAEFADVWYAAREMARKPIPNKDDIPLRWLAPFMPQLILHRGTADGRTLCLLFGTGLADLFGRDLTGAYLDDSMRPENAAARHAAFENYYAEHGRDAPFGRWVLGELRSSRGRNVQFESLALPYIEPIDGSIRHMAHVLALATLDHGEGLIPHFLENTTRMFSPDGGRPDWLHTDPQSPYADGRHSA